MSDWEQRELSTLMDFSNGINAPKEKYGKGRKMLSVLDILSPTQLKYEYIRNSVEVSTDIEKKNKVEPGDIVFVRSSEVVKEIGWAKAYTDDKYALFSGFTIRGKRKYFYNPYFIELYLNTKGRKQIERKAGGSTRFNISQEVLKKISVKVSEINEQTIIGDFFQTLDKMIYLHQRKINILERQKEEYLKILFTSNEYYFPKIRFIDFSAQWRNYKIEDYMGERTTRSAEGELISVTVNSGVVKADTLQRKDNSSENKSNYKIVKEGDIAYNSMRMWQGASGISPYNGILSPAYTVLIPKEHASGTFFSYLFKTHIMLHQFTKYSQGLTSDTWNLKYPLLKYIGVKVPSKPEQLIISEFLMNFDEVIKLHQNKIDKLSEVKQVYLNKMFI